MTFKDDLYLLPKYFISPYFIIAIIMTIVWVYLRKYLPNKRPQKLTIPQKLAINLPVFLVLSYIANSLYLILLENNDPFIELINLKKYINNLPTPIIELIYNNKYIKPKSNPNEIFPIYYILSCVNAIKNLFITWYQEGNAKQAPFEIDYETSLLLYYNRTGPTLMIFFIRAFFSSIIFIIKSFELDKYLLFFLSLVYRSTDFYYFIYYVFSKEKGYSKEDVYPKILYFWRLMEFVLIFSVIVYFFFQFLKYLINDNLKEFKHIMSLRLREYSLKDDCHVILFKLAEQTLRIEGTNGYNFNVNKVTLPTSFYLDKKLLTNNTFSETNFSKTNKLLLDYKKNEDNSYTLNDKIKRQKIESSKFQYKNWTNPNYNKYRNVYNPEIEDKSTEYELNKLNKINSNLSLNNHNNKIKDKNNTSNQLFNLFSTHHFSSFIRNHILRNNNYQLNHETYSNNNNNNEYYDKDKIKEHLLKKNWKSDFYYDDIDNIENSQDQQSLNEEMTMTMDSKKMSRSHSGNTNEELSSNTKEMNDYNEFLYNTYEENEEDDDDLVVDPNYVYSEIPSDTEESGISSSQKIIDQPKDTLYHELYDIMQDVDVINSLRDQNIIVDDEANQTLGITEDIEGIVTRAKYHKYLNSDEFLTATEGPSSQISSDRDTSEFKYSLPFRDTLASKSHSHHHHPSENEESMNSSSTNNNNSHQQLSRQLWKNRLRKLNPFKHSNKENNNNNAEGDEEEDKNSISNSINDEQKDPYELYRRTCVVCFDAQREIILWPCGCLSLCNDCRELMTFRNYKRCPCCQREVLSYSKINLP